MNIAITVLLPVFMAWVLMSCFYGTAVRPVLRDVVRFRLFALRDELRMRGIEGEVAASSFHYMYLEKLICRMIDRCKWYSWSSFFEFVIRYRDARPSADSQRFEAKAGDSLKQIHDRTVQEVLSLLMINSPVTTLALFVTLYTAKMFGAAWKQWIDIKTKIFAEEPINDGLLPA